VVSSVNLKRYAGKWYSIARLPSWFQNECAKSTATYEVRSDGKVGVVNECTTHTGQSKQVRGTAEVIDRNTNAKLVVTFDNWAGKVGLAKGDYWILDLGKGYQTAIVGTPDRKYLWFLARTPRISREEYARMVKRGSDLGFDTQQLIRDEW